MTYSPVISTTSSSPEEPFDVIGSDGEVVFSTKKYKEMELQVQVLIDMVGKEEFNKRLKEIKERDKIIKELEK